MTPTKSQTASMHTSPWPVRPESMQSVRPNARRMREMVYRSILGMEERIAALLANDVLTDSHRLSVISISKLLETMCSKFKAYPYEIVASIESDEAARQNWCSSTNTNARAWSSWIV